MDFVGFPKIPRLSRECVITEKIDGTNGQLYITDDGQLWVGSRTRWIGPGTDNHGFFAWAEKHRAELLKMGPGRYFGEWWGAKIQRGYGLANGDKRFSLFHWEGDELPSCLGVVPVLYQGVFSTQMVDAALESLRINGSRAVPGYMNPEGVVVYHSGSNTCFKKTLEGDHK